MTFCITSFILMQGIIKITEQKCRYTGVYQTPANFLQESFCWHECCITIVVELIS